MWKDIKEIKSSDENVIKFVFTKDDAVAESVLYKYPTYEDRTVICCSTQSGCAVGCRFCFLPGEMVDTVNGPIPIENVRVGEYVLSRDIVNKRNAIDSVNSLLSRYYDGKIIEILMENGSLLKVTEDHEMILIDGSVKMAKDLLDSDEIIHFY